MPTKSKSKSKNLVDKIKTNFGLNLSNTGTKEIPSWLNELEHLTFLDISKNSIPNFPSIGLDEPLNLFPDFFLQISIPFPFSIITTYLTQAK